MSVNGHLSDSQTMSTGSPQGCVLSPLLFIMCTDACRCTPEGSYLVKFSDDTALQSLLKDPVSDHGSALPDFTSWYEYNFFDLHVSKTKELIFDCRRKRETANECIIHDGHVEMVNTWVSIWMISLNLMSTLRLL